MQVRVLLDCNSQSKDQTNHLSRVQIAALISSSGELILHSLKTKILSSSSLNACIFLCRYQSRLAIIFINSVEYMHGYVI